MKIGPVTRNVSAIAQIVFISSVAVPLLARSALAGKGFYSMSAHLNQPVTATALFLQAIASVPVAVPPAPQPAAAASSGSQISLNGQLMSLPWQIRQQQIGLADMDLARQLGIHLFDTPDPTRQPIQWFSDESDRPVLGAWHDRQFRYLDIASLAATHNWQIWPAGNVLQIQMPPARILGVRHGQQPQSDRIVLDLAQPAITRLRQSPGEFSLTIEAQAEAAVIAAFNRNPQLESLQMTASGQQTVLQGSIERDRQVRVWSMTNPNRLIIDIRTAALVAQNVQWAPGLSWHQQYLAVADQPFPVYWLAIDPKHPQIKLRPIWSDPVTVVGTTPLATMAQRWQATAAINAGFFNRNNRLPLGAIRNEGRWISGPILGRGAVGWTDTGEVLIDRLALRQQLITSTGEAIPLQGINTGYVQAGVGLYTPDWGAIYTPITGQETLVLSESNQVTQQILGRQDTVTAIPLSGSLLAVRTHLAPASLLQPGTQLALESEVIPSAFTDKPFIASGGPLLLSNGTTVLNAPAESFSPAFANQAAARSAIGLTASGQILTVAVHIGPNGRGPTLAELSEIMRQLGCVEALNLDGGSSSSLYLAGTLINRPPQTAARIHNAIGIFFEP
ncbi:MAG: phosphodiester glycosidase family protein [Leptolyngbya sp. SIO4C5]|nr:phosphodiester glycosidase family protein [Leptolyngbya sp. SIO4C5]